MLADTDAGCLITAAESGAQFGYTMIMPQIILIPVLYIAQEMTVRLGIVTGKGHGELIRDYFGKKWAVLSAVTLAISAIGALLTEFIGIAGVGELFGISKWITIPIATVMLVGIAFSGSYRRVEIAGILIGLGELAFIIAIFLIKPDIGQIGQGLLSFPIKDRSYIYLIAANVGAVIMPWMIFYQQGAVIDKKISRKNLKKEKMDTAAGTVLTQLIMIVVVVVYAAVFNRTKTNADLSTVPQLANVLGQFIGNNTSKIIVGSAIFGGSMVAALVVALAGTWGITEVLGWKHSLNERLDRSNAGFYTIYALAHIVGAFLVLINFDLASLAVTVEVINALLLPIVLGFLILLESKALPKEYRSKGFYKIISNTLCLIVIIFGLYMIGPVIHLW